MYTFDTLHLTTLGYTQDRHTQETYTLESVDS